ncbi:MAG: DUF4292 domain-containing protein [Bacteroidia bacterium]|nr:DUF4292 domain-containing protein [Bacteroidia bacterium]
MVIRVYFFWWSLIFMLLTFGACKGIKNTTDADSEGKGWRAVLSKTESEKVQFEELSISGRAILTIPKANIDGMSVQYRIFMAKDSLIMIRVSKIIEAARILITRDSVFVLDKINKTYIACDYQIAKEYTGLDADFSLLQDLLLGNYHPIPEKLIADKKVSNPRTFRGTESGTDFAYSIDTKIHKVVIIEAKNALKNQESQINYQDFEVNGGTEIPMTATVSVSSPEPLSFEFQHKKVQINPGDASFVLGSVENYEQRTCK